MIMILIILGSKSFKLFVFSLYNNRNTSNSNNTDNYIGIPNECSICYKKLNKNDEKIILINNLFSKMCNLIYFDIYSY